MARRALRSVRVHDADLHVVDGPPGGAGNEGRVVIVAAHRGYPRGFGQAVAGHHRLEAEPVAHVMDHLHRDGRRSGYGETQRGEVEAIQVGVVQDGLVDGGRSGEHGDALLADSPHHRWHVEHRVGDERDAAHEAGEDPGVQAKGVEERVDDQVAVPGPEPDDIAPRLEGPTDRRVPEHGALRGSGGARCEHEVAEVVALDLGRSGGPVGVVNGISGGHELLP